MAYKKTSSASLAARAPFARRGRDMGRYGEIWGDMGRYGEIWREPRPRDAADKLPQRVSRMVGDEVAVDEHLMESEMSE